MEILTGQEWEGEGKNDEAGRTVARKGKGKTGQEETSAAQQRRWERHRLRGGRGKNKEKRRGESMELSWSLEEREEEGRKLGVWGGPYGASLGQGQP